MAILEPISWAAIGLSEPDRHAMWSQVSRQLRAIGFDQPGLVVDKPFFDRTFPTQPDLLGHVVSADWEKHFGYSNSDEYTGVSMASSMGYDTYVAPELLLKQDLPAEARVGIGELYEYGLVRGWTTPTRNMANNSVTIFLLATSCDGDEFDRLLEENRSSLRASIAFLLEGRDLRKRAEQEPHGVVSKREKECLTWAALGYSTKQISARLKLSDATVAEYLASAARKLGAANRAQAVARALLLNLVQP